MSGTKPIFVASQSKYYQNPTKPIVENDATNMPSTSTLPNSGRLHIEWPSNDSIIRPPPKGVLRKSSYDLNAQAAKHYNIVEDLAQATSVMSALEVLYTFPLQRKELLSTIWGIDPTDLNLITFDLKNHVPHLPHQLSFLLQVIIKGKTIHRTVIDEGVSTCIMSLSCWKAIGSPPLN